VGQEQAKRALQVAAAGRHNLLLVGSPGAGKSMLARAMRGILPPLTESEAIEVTKLHSIKGLAPHGLVAQRPFRDPHHTTSAVGLIGGGQQLLPGEISLAHQGVLFLDEFFEFAQPALEALRQPMEDGQVVITRAAGTALYPARFILVAAANPCPCGYHFHSVKACRCTELQINRYKKRLSGPIMDRIDLQLKMQSIDPRRFADDEVKVGQTAVAAKLVEEAQQTQLLRQGKSNATLSYKELRRSGKIQASSWQFLSTAASKFIFSSRGYLKILRVARTIADLEKSIEVNQKHITEALAYRIT
jgi:magnesium chelatase family protein